MEKIMGLGLLIMATNLEVAIGFTIVDSGTSHPHGAMPGDTITLKCESNEWFEYCTWKHRDRVCDFEWKKAHDAVKMQTCVALNRRVEFIGNYDAHECEIKLENVSEYDAGSWECEMESYVLGVVRGYKAKATVDVKVFPKPEPETTSTDYFIPTGSASPSTHAVDATSSGTTSTWTSTTTTATTTATRTSVTEEEDIYNEDLDKDYNDFFSSTASTSTTDPSSSDWQPSSSTDRSDSSIHVTRGNFTDHDDPSLSPRIGSLDLDADADVDGNPEEIKNSKKLPLVSIILGTTGAVFVMMVVGVFVLHRHRKKYNVDKEFEARRMSQRKMEMSAFANESSDDTDAEANDNNGSSSVKYLGATTYDVDEKTN